MPTLALFAWPLAVLALLRSLPRERALVWTALTGYLLLPERFSINLPGLPDIDKYSVIALTLLAVALTVGRAPGRRKPADGTVLVDANPVFGKVILVLLLVLFLTPILTILNNRAPLVFDQLFIPGLRPWDFVSTTWNTLALILPFLIARRCLATPEAHRTLLVGIAVAGLVYSLPMLFEVRMSPQLHTMVYGYFQHSWIQHVRGGFRPIVFLNHGLSVGFFTLTAVLAAFALSRAGGRGAGKWLAAGAYLVVILVLSKNLGATILALVFVPLFFLGPALRNAVILVTAVLILSYPMLRSAQLVPLQGFVNAVSALSEDRARSFQFRVNHEDSLLEKAAEKPLTGWGGWGRNRLYDEFGRDLSVTDGAWIVTIGTRGWPGYVAYFGLLALPLLMLPRVARREKVPVETIALAIIAAATLVDLIPNGFLSPISWMAVGALAGFIQFRPKEAAPAEEEDARRAKDRSRRRGYSRPPDPRTAGIDDAAPAARRSSRPPRPSRPSRPRTS
jgi:hypothetical protein